MVTAKVANDIELWLELGMAKFLMYRRGCRGKMCAGKRPAEGWGGGEGKNVPDSAIQLAKHGRLRVDSGQS